MPDFNLLGKLALDLHHEFVRIYYLMLPVFFALAVAVTWLRSQGGAVDFVDILKRAVLATLLLAAFPDISRAIIVSAEGIAERIDQTNSLNAVLEMAEAKANGYADSPKSILLMFDIVVATIAFLSYFILWVARFLTIAMYHFFWIFFMISAPLLLLFNVFRETSHITKNLFKGMIEVACWKIVWAILGAMLAALSFGDLYAREASYLSIVVMNLIIAIAMLMTPSMVKSLVGGGLQGLSTSIGGLAAAAIVAAPAKLALVFTKTKGAMNTGKRFANNRMSKFSRGKQK